MRREAFAVPPGIYLDGNSLGLQPHAAHARVQQRLAEWGEQAALGWDDWFGLAERLSPAIARLVGAHPDEVIATGSITSNLHALVGTLYRPEGRRRHIVATALDFPTDLYALAAWAERGGGELRLIPSRDGHTLHDDDLQAAFTDEVALVLLPTVLYRSGQLLDVAGLTAAAQRAGALIGWDAAHTIGALPHAFHEHGADFAVWCHYKYVNAGPGAPGGLYLHRRHHHLTPALPGWWGNDKGSQFEMAPGYLKASGAAAYQMGTPPILSLAALEGALSVFEDLEMTAVRERSLQLTDLLIRLADEHLPELQLVTPREHARRGGHVSFAHPEAHALSLALRARQIVPDYREPDVLRLAPVALYTRPEELETLVQVLRGLLDSGGHLQHQRVAGAVT
ncbi:kynureninase [Deinococcus sonorensis]|uniref:Kynureninase n=2 Tax=Deinococcus sonorensis TaxID=309891 RepID=A0AAU7UC38_9DEIO